MFQVFLSHKALFQLMLHSFFVIFLIRHLFFKKTVPIAVYHCALLASLFVAAIGGGGAISDGYERLDQFIQLEKSLQHAKQSPQKNSMLSIDLEQFKNSDEFMAHLKKYEHAVDCAESVTLGWFFVLLSDIGLLCAYGIRRGFWRPKNQ
jgi:hypothetical protein